MAEFIINVASGIVTQIAKYVIKPVGYIVFYNRNKNELKELLENLETTRKDVDLRVEDAKSKAYTIFTEVSEWLVAADGEKKKHDELFNSNPPCFNFLQRHQVSRKARKRETDICRLKDCGNKFLEVGCPAPLPDTKNTIVPKGYQILGSKTSMAKQIKDELAKPEVKKVGIYGMGGVGKTYLIKEVNKLVLEEKLFDLVIDVTVGQSNDVTNMQQIGDFLNKELPKSKEGRAAFLRNALVEMKGNILITFDDLCNEFDIIKDVGIPLSKEGCKTLMTSRFQNVLANKMNIKECFEVTCLDKEESWKFFKKIIGDEFDTTMENIAKEVLTMWRITTCT
ncbi:putative disease resistance protein [Cucumis melo var. makuwa]|uniref:Disease resistance protein n=2 Tax=Cucumis melo TaxID=3656 RepID=A0A5A7TLV0_CUCMM|nr:disease resistance protein SUMM2-like [Cucumis melo]KAA0042986.1 putative disease resistance protein [Cucumis melo var. makuwa]